MKPPAGWTRKALREVGECITGLTYTPEDVVKNGQGTLVLRSSNIRNGRLAFDDNVYVSHSLSKQSLTQDGDILVCVRNGSRSLIGKSALVDSISAGNAHGAFMMLFRAKNPKFAYQLFQSRQYRDQVNANLGATINSINSSDFYKFTFLFPPENEQVRIADLLSSWDKAIQQTEQLIQLRTKQKVWVLRQVVSATGKNVKLGEILKHVSRPVPKPSRSYWAMGIRSHGKGTFHRFVADPETVDMEELYAVVQDDLILNITFAWEGAIATVKSEDEHCLVSHRFPTYQVDRQFAYPQFIKHIVNRKAFFSLLALISPGGAGRNRVLNKKDFLKLTISLPPLEEQERLAETLEALDDLIEKERAILSLLSVQKQGLVQKLLTGKWTLKDHGLEAAE